MINVISFYIKILILLNFTDAIQKTHSVVLFTNCKNSTENSKVLKHLVFESIIWPNFYSLIDEQKSFHYDCYECIKDLQNKLNYVVYLSYQKNNFEMNFISAIDKTKKKLELKNTDVKDNNSFAQKDINHSNFCFVCSNIYYETNQNDITIEKFEVLKGIGDNFISKHGILNKNIKLYKKFLKEMIEKIFYLNNKYYCPLTDEFNFYLMLLLKKE